MQWSGNGYLQYYRFVFVCFKLLSMRCGFTCEIARYHSKCHTCAAWAIQLRYKTCDMIAGDVHTQNYRAVRFECLRRCVYQDTALIIMEAPSRTNTSIMQYSH